MWTHTPERTNMLRAIICKLLAENKDQQLTVVPNGKLLHNSSLMIFSVLLL